jgi:hypothetical protein
MKINQEVIEYLEGKRFSNGAYINIRQDKAIKDRISHLESLARNLKVIHLGFADHIPLIEEKMQKGIWLHKRLMDVASQCIGLDIDDEAVSFLSGKFGISQLYKHDVITDEPLERITSETWDLFIIGEVLEHIDNPVLFLSEIRKKYGPYVREFVITVPNAWDYENVRFLFRSIECVNTDHRYWFTPFTLSKVCSRAGFKVKECNFISNGISGRKKAFILRRFPFLQSGLIVTLTP